jgi:hypothetical protein
MITYGGLSERLQWGLQFMLDMRLSLEMGTKKL